jgi:hypothetical protein
MLLTTTMAKATNDNNNYNDNNSKTTKRTYSTNGYVMNVYCVDDLLVHMQQNEKIALEIALKVASV